MNCFILIGCFSIISIVFVNGQCNLPYTSGYSYQTSTVQLTTVASNAAPITMSMNVSSEWVSPQLFLNVTTQLNAAPNQTTIIPVFLKIYVCLPQFENITGLKN